jgi:methylmalonyl-CoA mutase C-terminal domain/subunit
MAMLREKGLSDLVVLVGGNIPRRDVEKLEALGVAAVFPTGSRFENIVAFIEEKVGQ